MDMSELALFDLVITGHHAQTPADALAREILDLLDINDVSLEEQLTLAFQSASCSFTICQALELKAAMLWQKKLSAFAVKSELRPVEPLEAQVVALEMYSCPACRHEQTKLDGKSIQICQVCGVAGQIDNSTEGLHDLVYAEQQRRETEKTRAINEALKKAKYLEERRLREEELRHIKPAPAKFAQLLLAVVGSFTIVVGLGIAYFFTDSQANSVGLLEPVTTVTSETSQTNSSKQVVAMVPALDQPTEPMRPQVAVHASVEAVSLPESNATVTQSTVMKTAEEPSSTDLARLPSEKLLQALESLEDIQQLQPQAGIASRSLRLDRERIQQLLKMNETALISPVITAVQKPYAQSLLLLDYAQWQIQQGQAVTARETIESMRKVLASTRDIDQQVLILGALSQAYLLNADAAKAEDSLLQAIAKAAEVPKRSFQTWLLVQLANEQALMGNPAATHKLLKLAESLLPPTLVETTANTAKPAQIISLYALTGAFAEAKTRLNTMTDLNKRATLSAWLNQLEASLN